MAENEIEGPALGVSWDGTGYGLDGTVWGGEFFRVDGRCVEDSASPGDQEITDPNPSPIVHRPSSIHRFAHLRTFRLPGGEKAIKEPRRAAMGLLYELVGSHLFVNETLAPVLAFSAQERQVLKGMLEKGINSPITSSTGRLFDAVASLVGLRHEMRFEGQAGKLSLRGAE
jgi:hydrogenase maturation protein HypF